MDSNLFYTLGYNTILLYFVAQFFSSLPIGSSFYWLLCPRNMPASVGFECFVCSIYFALFSQHSLLPVTTSFSRFILYIPFPALGSAISPRSPDSSYGGMAFATKIWALGVLFTTKVSLLPGPLSRQSKEMDGYMLIYVYARIYK